MTKDEHIDLLKAAIVANLTARIEHDKRQTQEAERRGELPKLRYLDLTATDPVRLDLDPIIKDPVRYALREQLRDLGQRLFDLLGSVRVMSEMAWELADRTPHAGLAFTIMDKGWDGVGKGRDWWCHDPSAISPFPMAV